MKTIEEYADMSYHFVLTHDQDEGGRDGWVVEVEELPGCISQGRTPDEALKKIRDAMAGWMSVALEDGQEIPQPRAEDYSGRFVIRMAESLHADLARAAAREGVSLNQFVTSALAGSIAWRRSPTRTGK
jgi:antitoxin HicB